MSDKIWMAQLGGKEYNTNWKQSKGGGKSFNEIMEYNGGLTQELILGKVYVDGFRD